MAYTKGPWTAGSRTNGSLSEDQVGGLAARTQFPLEPGMALDVFIAEF